MASLSDLICEEIMWATKAAHSIEAGYVRLETAEEGRWGPAQVGDNAYYVCALFADGRHIPLPLLLPGGPIDTLQARVIEAARADGNLDECVDDCARFCLASGSHDDPLETASAEWLESRDPAFVFTALAYKTSREGDPFSDQPATKAAATVGVCRDCLVPVEFDGHVYTCPECGAHTRYDNKTGEVDGVTLLTVEITPGLARKFGLTYVGSPGERVELPYLRRSGDIYVPCKYPKSKEVA